MTTHHDDTPRHTQEIIHFNDALMIVARGVASRAGRVKTPGAYWGQDFILMSSELKDRTPCCALTYVEILALPRDRFYEVGKDDERDTMTPRLVSSDEIIPRPAARRPLLRRGWEGR